MTHKPEIICETCRFWNPLKPGGDGVFEDGNYTVDDMGTGECRFNPPIGTRDQSVLAIGADSMTAAIHALWPITLHGHWCGQHRAKVSQRSLENPSPPTFANT